MRAKRKETPAFQAFYAVYPRKTARDRAWRNWLSVGAESFASEIFAALDWQVPKVFAKCPADKIPHPGTWLHDGRWKDEKPWVATTRPIRPSSPPVPISDVIARAAQLEEAAEVARKIEAERYNRDKATAEASNG